jgi:hypothetical protein
MGCPGFYIGYLKGLKPQEHSADLLPVSGGEVKNKLLSYNVTQKSKYVLCRNFLNLEDCEGLSYVQVNAVDFVMNETIAIRQWWIQISLCIAPYMVL